MGVSIQSCLPYVPLVCKIYIHDFTYGSLKSASFYFESLAKILILKFLVTGGAGFISSNLSNAHLNSPDESVDSQCKKLFDRLEQIGEQEDRGGLNEEQAKELRQRIESLQDNLECQ